MTYLTLRGKECEITIESRPHYCDRGRFLAKIHPIPGTSLDLDLDSQDGWPRYYFYLDCAHREIEAWLRRRSQWLPNANWAEGEAPQPTS